MTHSTVAIVTACLLSACCEVQTLTMVPPHAIPSMVDYHYIGDSIGGSFATNLAWRLLCYRCIAGEVSTKEDVTTAAPKTKSNAQGEGRM